MERNVIALGIATLLLGINGAIAAPKERLPLSPQLKAVADSARESVRIEKCCHSTLAQCLGRAKPCPLAMHLDTFTTWVAGIESTYVKALDQVDKRYKTLVSDTLVRIDTAGLAKAGDPSSPVLVVFYVSSLCPLCKYVTSEVYQAVTSGTLFKKARLMIKPFASAPGDRALVVANEKGRVWDFFLAMANVKDRIDGTISLHIADSLGLDTADFRTRMRDAKTTAQLEAGRKEGVRIGVTVTPGVYINGKPYHSFKDPQWVIDAIEYSYETVPAKKKKK